MKKVIKKSVIKAQNGIDPERAANMARNAQTRDYILKKAQLVKDQSAFSATLPEQIGGNRPLTAAELAKKNKFKSDISAYGDSIMMNRQNLSKDELIKKYAKGKEYGLKQEDRMEKCGKRGFGADQEGCSSSESSKQRMLKREANRKNGGPIKKSKTMKAKKSVYQAGGVAGGNSKKKAPLVDPKGAFTKVQQRTIAKKKTSVPKKK